MTAVEEAANPRETGARAAQRQHLRGSSLMVVGRLLSMVLNLAVQVVAVRTLGKTDYGIFAYAVSIGSLGASASILGQDAALGRFLALHDEQGDHGRGQGVIVVTFATVFLLGSALVAGLVGLHAAGVDITDDHRAVAALLILAASAPFTALDTMFLTLFAVVAEPTAIFWRRHVLGPGLRLASVLLIMVTSGSVEALAVAYLVSGIIGIGLYVVLAVKVLRRHPLGRRGLTRTYPVRQMWAYGLPLVTSDVVQTLRATLVVVFLEAMRSVDEVGAFRAVVPVAQLNAVAMQSFRLLYLPQAARLFARDDSAGVAGLYWQSAAWLAVGTFPVFVATFALAEPVTRLLFGAAFASSAPVLAVMALGHYVSAALGLNVQTLRASGQVKLVALLDGVTAVVGLGLNLVLIRQFGALGAGLATTGVLLLQNLLVHVGLRRVLDGLPLPAGHRPVYASVAAGALALLAVQQLVRPPLAASLALAVVVSGVVVVGNRRVLRVADTFPEAGRLPLVGRYLVGGRA